MRPSKPGWPVRRRDPVAQRDDDDLQFRRETAEASDRFARMVDNLRKECGIEFVSVRRDIQKFARAAGEAMLTAAASRILEVKAESESRLVAQAAAHDAEIRAMKSIVKSLQDDHLAVKAQIQKMQSEPKVVEIKHG